MFETTNQNIIESSSNSGFEQSSTDPGDHKSPFYFPQPITPEKHLHLTREASPQRQQRAATAMGMGGWTNWGYTYNYTRNIVGILI